MVDGILKNLISYHLLHDNPLIDHKKIYHSFCKVDYVITDSQREFLNKRLGSLKKSDDAIKRGREFEDFLKNLLQFSGYQTIKDRRSVNKEQFDLISVWGNNIILIEAKWQKKPVELPKLQSFMWRVSRRGNLTIGIYISWNGFSDPSLKEILFQERTILLFDKQDIIDIIEKGISFENVLKNKIFEIQLKRVPDSKFSFKNLLSFQEIKSIDKLVDISQDENILNIAQSLDNNLPVNNYMNFIKTSNEFKYITNQFGNIPNGHIFVSSIMENIGSYDIISIQSLQESEISLFYLETLLTGLNNFFGLNEELSFTIINDGISWSGYRIQNFIEFMRNQNDRYISVENYHSSELLAFFQPITTEFFFVLQVYDTIGQSFENRFRQIKLQFCVNSRTTQIYRDKITNFCNTYGLTYTNKTQLEKNVVEYKFNPGGITINEISQNIYKKSNFEHPVGLILENPLNEYEEKSLDQKLDTLSDACYFVSINDLQDETSEREKSLIQLVNSEKWIGYYNNPPYQLDHIKNTYISYIQAIELYFPGNSIIIYYIEISYPK